MKIPGFIFFIHSQATGLRYQSVIGYDSEELAGRIAYEVWRSFYAHILDATIYVDAVADIRAYAPPPLPPIAMEVRSGVRLN